LAENGQARTCVVADDHPSVLRTVTELMRAWGWTIVASSSNGDDALAKIAELHPAIAVLDLQLPGRSGLDIVRDAQRAFVVKEAPLEGLNRALETVAGGGRYVDPVVSAALLLESDGPSLTDRERAVLRLIADGYSYDEAGKELFISPETVRAHVAKSLTKLGARTRTQAVAEALRSGLIA